MVSKNYKQFAQNVVGVLDSEISLQEFKSEIQKLKNNKTSGNDSIANEMIKASSDVILPTLCNLFNKILNREYFPKMWSVGFIVPIYKSDGCDNPINYRSITITSCVGKLFTSVINQRIIKFVEKQRIVSHHQIGLKKSYRTADHIFIVKTLINKYLHKGKNCTCVLWILKRLTTVYGEMDYFIN